MSRIKSKKYNGVYLNHLANKDISYSITFKDEFNKLIRFTVGKKSQGITEIYAYNKRNEFINKVRLGEDPLAYKKKKSIWNAPILYIKKKDINLARNSVLLLDLKNNSTYTGFLNDDVKNMLEPYLNTIKTDDYVLSGKITRLSDNAMARTIRPTLNKLFNKGLAKDDRKNRVVIHTFRHTFASHLAINGTPIFTIQKLMNHKDIKMTMRYAKLAPDSGMDMVKNLYR